MISWAMCTTFFLFISSSCWKNRNTVTEIQTVTSLQKKHTSAFTHRLTANHHDHWILLHCGKPSGLSCSASQTTAQSESRAATFPFLPLSPYLSPSLPVSFWWCVLWNGNGAVSPWLNLDSGLGPLSTEMSYWSYRSLYLWYPGALRGIRHRCWQYHGGGHTGRSRKKKKNQSLRKLFLNL